MTMLLDRSERRKCLWSIQKGYESVKKPMAHAEKTCGQAKRLVVKTNCKGALR